MPVLSSHVPLAFPWRAYFSQSVFERDTPAIWNPRKFARLYRIDYLNRCWLGDCVRMLEGCWRQNYDRHGELSADS